MRITCVKRRTREISFDESHISKSLIRSVLAVCGNDDSKKIQEIISTIIDCVEFQPKSALEILIDKCKRDVWCPEFKVRSLVLNPPLLNYRSLLKYIHRKDICKPKSKHKLLWTIGVYRGPDYKEGRYETSVGSKEVI